eukprot:4727689-Prymnesium_polylepis.1
MSDVHARARPIALGGKETAVQAPEPTLHRVGESLKCKHAFAQTAPQQSPRTLRRDHGRHPLV